MLQHIVMGRAALFRRIVLANAPMRRSVYAAASSDKEDLRRNVLSLYRFTLRKVPDVLRGFNVHDLSVSECRARLTAQFRAFAHLEDLETADNLRIKAEMDLEETLMGHKTRSHIYRLLAPVEDMSIDKFDGVENAKRSAFLDSFFKHKE